MVQRLRRPIVWVPVSLGLLALVVWRSRLWEAGEHLGPIDARLLLAALLIGQATPLLWALRSRNLLAAAGRRVPFLALLPMTSFANTINNLTPGSAGELVRLYLLRTHHDVDYRTGAAVILIERFVALGYLSISGLLLWIAWLRDWSPLLTVALIAGLVAAPAVVYGVGVRPLGIVAALPLGRAAGVGRWEAWRTDLGRIDATIGSLLVHPARLMKFSITTGAVFAVSTVQLLLVAGATGLSLDPRAAWGALGLSISAGVLSFLPFGLGAADLVLVALLTAIGVPTLEAGVIAFGYRLVSTLPYALEGVAAYAWLSARLPDGDVRRAAREAAAAGLNTGSDRPG
jgi:uncharacterized membrane protein YbhN (UPF0104 family)